jgi:peptide/nickel transport system substrate-binding protein
LAALLYSYLVKVDDRGRLVPDAARTVPTLENGGISPSGLTVTYHLRAGLRFSDGRTLTASDVAYTIGRVALPTSDVPSRLGFDDVAAVETPDPLTVRVHLRRPFAPITLYLCAPGSAIPILPSSGFGNTPVGSGPYLVERWDRDDSLALVANPRYFGGPPPIARIVIRFVPSSTTAIQALAAGEADAYVNADDSQYEELRRLPGVRVDDVPIDGTGALIFNTQDPTLRDPRIRHAVAQALDTRDIIDKTLQGSSRANDPGRGLFLWAYDPNAFAMPAYDPHAAAALLERAGWVAGADGMRRRAGVPLVLDLIVRSDKPSGAAMAVGIEAAAAAVGIGVTIRRFPVVTLVAPNGPLYGGRFQMALFPFLAGFDPDVTDQFACNRIPPHGFNKPRYCNPRLDAILARAEMIYSRSRRVALYRQAQAVLARDLPLDALYQGVSINAFPKSLRNQTTAVTTPFWNVAAWRMR